MKKLGKKMTARETIEAYGKIHYPCVCWCNTNPYMDYDEMGFVTVDVNS